MQSWELVCGVREFDRFGAHAVEKTERRSLLIGLNAGSSRMEASNGERLFVRTEERELPRILGQNDLDDNAIVEGSVERDVIFVDSDGFHGGHYVTHRQMA